jgi:hypothetical protein
MSSRRVGRPCARTVKPKTVKIKIAKPKPKTVKIKIAKPKPKTVKIKIAKPKPKTVKIKIKKEKPQRTPTTDRKALISFRTKAKRLNAGNRLKMVEAQKLKAFKERAKTISASNRLKVANRRRETADKKQEQDQISALKAGFDRDLANKVANKKANKKVNIKSDIEREIEMEEKKLLDQLRASMKYRNKLRMDAFKFGEKFKNVPSFASMVGSKVIK